MILDSVKARRLSPPSRARFQFCSCSFRFRTICSILLSDLNISPVEFRGFSPHFAAFIADLEDFASHLAPFTLNFEVLHPYFAPFTMYFEDFTLYLASFAMNFEGFTPYLEFFTMHFEDFTLYLAPLPLRIKGSRVGTEGADRMLGLRRTLARSWGTPQALR